MIKVTVKTSGKKHNQRIIASVRRSMNQAGKDVLVVAKTIVPLDEGSLRASGKVTSKRSKNRYEVKVSFGNEQVDYARDQHDTPYFHSNGREMHYLINPFKLMVSGLKARIKNNLRIGK